MTQDHGVLNDEVANGAVLPVVNIRAANPGIVDSNKDIMGAL
ncbi:hypothetical protein PC116_g32097 [Phytophthora cactorum]|nr:hypothetical protein PC116_g32097 [Phytophthora cactorum]